MGKVIPVACSCIFCKKETSNLGLHTHYHRMHGDASSWQKSIDVKNQERANRKSAYELNPNRCKHCNAALPYLGNKNYCNHSCSASGANITRRVAGWRISDESKEKIKTKLQSEFNRSVAGEYSKLTCKTCRFCTREFLTPKARTITCFDCKKTHARGQDIFRFKFNVYDYPELFDLDLLNERGWFSQGGKSRKPYNPTGLSRDHKVSVHDAKLNNYPHYYITHPCNCELMDQSSNSSKNKKSSITFEELVKAVHEFEIGVKCRTRTD